MDGTKGEDMDNPGKTLKVGGTADAEINSAADQLIITPQGGLVTVTVFDTRGLVVWMHHPLSGWYIEVDNRKPESTEKGEQ
jgi:hypothetical protein